MVCHGSSFKWHASCRHTHPSVDALLALMDIECIKAKNIDIVEGHTYRSAINILSLSEKAETVHQSKFSMGFVLAVAAYRGSAKITDFSDKALLDPKLRDIQKRVKMVWDEEMEKGFPEKWLGKVVVSTKSGERYEKGVDVVKGDPGWTLSR